MTGLCFKIHHFTAYFCAYADVNTNISYWEIHGLKLAGFCSDCWKKWTHSSNSCCVVGPRFTSWVVRPWCCSWSWIQTRATSCFGLWTAVTPALVAWLPVASGPSPMSFTTGTTHYQLQLELIFVGLFVSLEPVNCDSNTACVLHFLLGITNLTLWCCWTWFCSRRLILPGTSMRWPCSSYRSEFLFSIVQKVHFYTSTHNTAISTYL